MGDTAVTLFLCGDTMLGRGVDQILPCPGDPTLREPFSRDAGSYVELAEAANGPIPRPVDAAWPWGDALRALDDAAPDVRVVNLETAVTRCGAFAPGKSVHYRMNPDNLPCLVAGRPDVCVLANNHVLDFGRRGLLETLDALSGAGIAVAGAGRDAAEASRPAAIPLPASGPDPDPEPGEAEGGRSGRRGRVLVFAFGMPSSGIPTGWAAAGGRPGVNLVPDLTAAWADDLAARARRARRPGDLAVMSVHWGSNWGYEVDGDAVSFAHRLVDGGIDLVHGHSSHHPRPVEVYRDRLILYGCGDFIDDYEGIGGYQGYRDDLRLAYLVSLHRTTGALTGLRILPFQARRMRLWPASPDDRDWLRDVLNRTSQRFRARFATDDGLGGLCLSRRTVPQPADCASAGVVGVVGGAGEHDLVDGVLEQVGERA